MAMTYVHKVQIVLTTHKLLRHNMEQAIDLINRLDVVEGKATIMRIEDQL